MGYSINERGDDSCMEAKERTNYSQQFHRTSYIEGNTVRKLDRVPDIRREEEQEYEAPARRRQRQSQPKVLSGINFASLIMLVIAITITVFVCYEYLTMQARVSNINKQIKVKQMELSSLTKENDSVMNKLDKAVDLDKIYQIAVGEYGMVYPKDNTIISFESSDSDYVRQYEDIPQ